MHGLGFEVWRWIILLKLPITAPGVISLDCHGNVVAIAVGVCSFET